MGPAWGCAGQLTGRGRGRRRGRSQNPVNHVLLLGLSVPGSRLRRSPPEGWGKDGPTGRRRHRSRRRLVGLPGGPLRRLLLAPAATGRLVVAQRWRRWSTKTGWEGRTLLRTASPTWRSKRRGRGATIKSTVSHHSSSAASSHHSSSSSHHSSSSSHQSSSSSHHHTTATTAASHVRASGWGPAAIPVIEPSTSVLLVMRRPIVGPAATSVV